MTPLDAFVSALAVRIFSSFSVHDLVGVSDRELRERSVDELHFVVGFQGAFGKHSQIPTGPSGLLNSHSQFGQPPPLGQFPAWLARLRNLQLTITGSKNIANAGIGFDCPASCQIFAETTVNPFDFVKFGSPERIMFGGINQDGFINAAVMDRVRLLITHQAGGCHPDWPVDG